MCAGKIMQTEQLVFMYLGIFIHTYTTTIKEKEAMYLKENKGVGTREILGGRMGRGNDVINFKNY